MARAHLVMETKRSSGAIVSGATLVFYEWPETSPLTPLVEPIYATATTSTALTTDQKVTDSSGRFDAYKQTPGRVIAVSTYGGTSVQTVEHFTSDEDDQTVLKFDARVQGAKGDGVVVTDGAMTSGTTTLTSASNPFPATLSGATIVGLTVTVMNTGVSILQEETQTTNGLPTITTNAYSGFRSADIGKKITVAQGGSGGTPLVTKVLSVASQHTLTMVAAAQNTVGGGVTANTVQIEPFSVRTTIAERLGAGSVRLTAPAPDTISGATIAFGTDDTLAIQRAIDAAFAAGGGDVVLTGGRDCTFMTGPLTLKDGVNLRGDGCTLRRLPGATGTLLKTATTTTALSDVTISNLTIENDQTDDHVFQVGSGCSRLTFDRMTISGARFGVSLFINSTGGSNTADNTDITITNCSFIGYGAKNGGTIGIPNGVNVLIEDSYFYLPGSVSLEVDVSSTNGRSRNIRVLNNTFEDGACTLLLFGPGAANNQIAEDILVQGNRFTNIGWQIRKGVMVVGNNNTLGITGAIVRRLKFLDNIVHHWNGGNVSGTVGGGCIILNGPPFSCEDIEISGNTLDGTYASTARSFGTADTYNSALDNPIGITMASTSRALVARNVIRYCGSAAISVASSSHVTIADNLITYACQIDGSGYLGYEAYAAIAIVTACTNIKIAGNTVQNTGSSTANSLPWAGIGIAAGTRKAAAGGDAIVGSSHLEIVGNRCYDDRAPKIQNYGIRLGFSPVQAATEAFEANPNVAATQPTTCIVANNDCQGNLTDGIYEPTHNATSVGGVAMFEGSKMERDHTIYNNLGYLGGQGRLVFRRTGIAADGAGDTELGQFFLTLTPSPFAATLWVMAQTGDVYAGGYYNIMRTNSSGATQRLSSAYGTVATAGGAIPVLTSLSEPNGTWQVDNAMASIVTITVILMPVLQH